MKSDLTTSIIAGKYKGIKLSLPSLESTRSTKSIMKESLFNTLQFDIVGENFIEVFGGSGSIGLEALSRGAKHAYFIELDKKAFSILKQNCKKISLSDTSCHNANSFEALQKVLKELTTPAYIYIDPPFNIREGMQDVYEKTINLIEQIPSSSAILIIVEHMSSWKMPEFIGTYSIKKVKKFGKSTLSYYQ
jgi:16S rRNA (guanine(966)-N(2))-methyltransferase RsmD